MIYNLDLNTHFLKRKQSSRRYWQFVNKNNLLGTAITENAKKNPKKAYFDLLKEKPKANVLIPGMTISTDLGEVLVYAPNEDIYSYNVFFEENVSMRRIYDMCERKDYLFVIAHPFGLINNSASYLLGLSKLEKFIKEKNVGVEGYNGMMGYITYYMYDSFFVKTLRDLLWYIQKHRAFNIAGISKIADKLNQKIDQKSYDLVYKFSATIKLAQMAKFVTAGSGTDYVDRIGSGVLTIDLPKSIIDETNTTLQNQAILNKILKKQIISFGPPGKYTDQLFERSTARITKRKAYNDLMHLTKTAIEPKKQKKTKEKKPVKEKEEKINIKEKEEKR
ncbi:MAG TPA: hypothetical protein P5530_02905 [Candidatus Diapherotrites archaeon]|nr:hypothetical protein [Candidatus Diapherotrites archaeon]